MGEIPIKPKYGQKMALVKGRDSSGNEIEFYLNPEEIKHIRRALGKYDNYFGRDIKKLRSPNLSLLVHYKFSKFGRMKRRLSSKDKREIMEGVERKCNYKGCGEREHLTIDHKIRLSGLIYNANSKENLQYLCPKHHLLKELELNKSISEAQLEKLKKRIEEIKEKNTTDCLGYLVLSPTKFDNINRDEVIYETNEARN